MTRQAVPPSAEAPRTDGARFKDLLTPIRDPMASWSVDIVNQLCQYADCIGLLVATNAPDAQSEPPDTPALVDFAEAALIVQGSASIYSRKVEHLYSLVFSAVSSLHTLGGRDGPSDATAAGSGRDDTPDDHFNIDDVDFLTLDDHIVEADARQITQPPESLPPPGSLLDTTCLRPVPPMLVQHASPVDTANLDKAKFKILTAVTHPSGALIAEGCPPVDENLDTISIPFNQNDPQLSDYDNEHANNHDDGDDGQSVGPPMDDADDAPSFFPSQQGESCEITSPRPQNAAGQNAPHRPERPPTRDAFAMLDPHEDHKRYEKPPRPGKCYRKPSARKRNKTAKPMPATWQEDEYTLITSMIGQIPRKSSFNNYVCTDAARDPLRSIVRRRNAKRRALQYGCTDEDSDCDVQVARSAGDGLHRPESAEMEDVLLFDDDGDALGFGGCGGDDDVDMRLSTSLDGHMPDALQNDGCGLFGDDDSLDACTLGKKTRLGGDLETQASSYATACDRYLKMTAWMWEQRVVDTKLAKRVEDWTTRIHPLLEKEERRREFDIREYGESIMQSFRQQEDQGTMKMSKLLRSTETYDVCRLFLSALQLSNQSCIEILPEDDADTCEVADPDVRCLALDGQAFLTPLARTKRKRMIGSTPPSQKRQPSRLRIASNICT